MDTALLITLSAQNALTRQMEVAANNMANVSTIGFKSEAVLFQSLIRRPASMVETPNDVEFVRDYSVARDFRPGALQRTDNPLDIALTGAGFFSVATATGPAYTRDGRLTLDPSGKLINHDGKAILDDGGGEINIDVDAGPVVIGKDGTITQNGASVAKIGVVNFARPGALQKTGDNLWRSLEQAPAQAENFEVVQGMLEGSNVVAIRELTSIMEISRAFESATRLQRQTEELRSKAIDRLSRVQV